jgi:hypothetical protein
MCLGSGDCQPGVGAIIAGAMNEADKKARLAEALRANLRKRKVQAREQAEAPPPPPAPSPAED